MKIKIALLTIISMGILYSCNKKDDFNYPKDTVGISTIRYYPSLTLKGELYLTVEKGTAFVDPGVISKEGTADLPYITSGTVDVNTPGVYYLTYKAVGKEGTATKNRFVIVYSTDESAAAHDLSGVYKRTSNGELVPWTKLAPGVYKAVNLGGGAGGSLVGIFFNPTGYTIKVPPQVLSDGNPITTTSKDESYNPNTSTYTITFLSPSYLDNVRTFVKQ